MAMHTTSNPADVTYQMQTFFSKKLLEPLENNLTLPKYGAALQEIPKNAGATSVRFYRRRPASTANVVSLTEGTPISTYDEVTMGYVDVSLTQIGQAMKTSDIRSDTAIFNLLQQHIETMGEDAALKCSNIIRAAIHSGMKDLDNAFERFCGVAGPNTDSSASYDSLYALSADQARLTRLAVLGAVTTLKANRVPKVNGRYIAQVAPQVMYDIRQDEDWLAAATNAAPEQLFKDEVISLDGVAFVEQDDSIREGDTYGTYSATGTVFSTLVHGKNFYGVTKLAGSGDPNQPKVFIHKEASKSDPLNQYVLVGWKAFYAACLLLTNLSGDVPHGVIVRSKSTYQG